MLTNTMQSKHPILKYYLRNVGAALLGILLPTLLIAQAAESACDHTDPSSCDGVCVTDTGSPHTFPNGDVNSFFTQFATTTQVGMTSANCKSICGGLGYYASAVEGGSNCYCGTQTDWASAVTNSQIPAPAAGSPPTACQTACSGDATQMCGGTGQMNVYTTGISAPVAPGSPAPSSAAGSGSESES